MPGKLVVPSTVENIILDFDKLQEPVRELDIQSELKRARKQLENLTEEEKLGTWAEVLAFALVPSRAGASPWNTYFSPMGSGTNADGGTVYFPDIAGTDSVVVDHWSERAHAITSPVIKARYADLAWDMCIALGKERRDKRMAEIAIDAYLASAVPIKRPDLGDQLRAGIRALDLAIIIRDTARVDTTRRRIIDIHREAVTAGIEFGG